MTFVVNITGQDDLTGNEKAGLENEVVDETRALVDSLGRKHGCRIIVATVNTNTTGVVNILDPGENDV